MEARMDGEFPPTTFAVRLGLEDQVALVARHDLLLLGRLDEGEAVAELDHALHLGLAHRLLGDASRRAADVEGAPRELRAPLAPGLRRPDAGPPAPVPPLPGCRGS